MQLNASPGHPPLSSAGASPPDPATDATPAQLRALQVSAQRACALLKVLAHEDRLILLCRLAQGEHCVSELESGLGIRQPTLSQQLGVLRKVGLVGTRRQGKRVYYRLASEDARAIMGVLHERLCGQDGPPMAN